MSDGPYAVFCGDGRLAALRLVEVRTTIDSYALLGRCGRPMGIR